MDTANAKEISGTLVTGREIVSRLTQAIAATKCEGTPSSWSGAELGMVAAASLVDFVRGTTSLGTFRSVVRAVGVAVSAKKIEIFEAERGRVINANAGVVCVKD